MIVNRNTQVVSLRIIYQPD